MNAVFYLIFSLLIGFWTNPDTARVSPLELSFEEMLLKAPIAFENKGTSPVTMILITQEPLHDCYDEEELLIWPGQTIQRKYRLNTLVYVVKDDPEQFFKDGKDFRSAAPYFRVNWQNRNKTYYLN